MKEDTTLGERLKKLRVINGYSREKVAQRCDTSRLSIFNYEANKYRPPMDKLEKLAELYDTTPQYLMFGIDNQKIDNIVIEEREDTQTLEDTTQDGDYIGDLINYIVKHRETAKILYNLIKSIEKSKK